MARSRKTTTAPKSTPVVPATAARTGATRAIEFTLIVALLAAAIAIDPFAQGAFDAPKRLAVVIAATVAGAVWSWHLAWPRWRGWSTSARAIVGLLALAALAVLAATANAAHPDSAWTTLRLCALFALFLPLGASSLLDARARSRIATAALLAVVINAALSLLQAAGVALPFAIAQIGGRLPTGALLGNEGYVALACAMLAPPLLLLAWERGRSPLRPLWVASATIVLAAIVCNRQLTSAIACAVAIAVVFAARRRALRSVLVMAALGVLTLATAFVPIARDAPWSGWPLGSAADYQRATTYRVGAWAAASEMVRARPGLGFGPGSFAEQAQVQRFRAELRLDAHLPPSPPSSAFTAAHNDYLQLAAEVGLPATLAVIAALLSLVGALLRRAGAVEAVEARVLLGVIVAGAVAALAWFPLQIPSTAMLWLLACGRAWRLIADRAGTES